jgi:hypothetical protein
LTKWSINKLIGIDQPRLAVSIAVARAARRVDANQAAAIMQAGATANG